MAINNEQNSTDDAWKLRRLTIRVLFSSTVKASNVNPTSICMLFVVVQIVLISKQIFFFSDVRCMWLSSANLKINVSNCRLQEFCTIIVHHMTKDLSYVYIDKCVYMRYTVGWLVLAAGCAECERIQRFFTLTRIPFQFNTKKVCKFSQY